MIDLKKLFHQKETETKKEEVKEMVETAEKMQSTQVETTIQAHKCLRCGHVWIPRKKEKPRVCPKCKSPYWDKPKG
jgi:predicted Zn-ribbon and HTH transcriptional regulator